MIETFLPIPQNRLEELATFKSPYSVSIYLPMYKSGKEQNEGLSQAHLKSSLKKVQQNLLDQGMDQKEIKAYLEPISDLIPDMNLWRHPSEGLVIFLDTEKGITFYKLPIKFKPEVYVSDHYYLVPLMPLFEFDASFYLLTLSQDHVKLYRGNQYQIEDLYVNDFAPERLEEAVGFDFEQKMLQFRTGQALHSAGSFHGQGEGKDDDTKEISFFFREINRGVNKTIETQNTPLILACVDWLYPLYKSVNTYNHLYPEHLSGDPEFKDKSQLLHEAQQLINRYLLKKKKQIAELYDELVHTPKTSHQISDIVPAAKHGRIDTLFLRKGDEVYGTYNKKNNCVILDSEKAPRNLSLINMAALDSLLQGGKVLTLDPEDMPIKKRPLNAIFRY